MKWNKIIYTIFSLLFVVHFIGCKKWLDEKPSNEVLTPITLTDLQGLLDNANKMNKNLTPGLGETCADDYFLTQSRFDALTNAPASKDFYLWQKTKYSFQNDWSQSYQPVYIANYCLEQLEKIPRTGDNGPAWDNVKGSALFYRAYNFLNLLWNYAKAYDPATAQTDLGIVLRLGADFNEPSKRSNTAAGYQQVIEDVRHALPLLPKLPSHVYRPSKWASNGLLARTFLSMRQYDSALLYATSSLSIRDSLLNFSDLKVDDLFPFPLFNIEIMFYSEMYEFLPTVGRGYFDSSLVRQYLPDDLRTRAFFRKSGNYYSRKGTYAGDQGKFSGIATDEMFLIRAECNLRAGQLDVALNDYNKLLRKRFNQNFVPINESNTQVLLQIILNERRKELLFRGLRWMDIKRLNKEGANIILERKMNGQSYILEPNDDFYALPLPDDIVALTGIPQNP